MNRTNSEAAVYVDSFEAQENSAEIDLYDDLAAFERLTPDEQARLAVHPAITAAKEDSAIKDSAQSAECNTDSGKLSTSFEETHIGDDLIEAGTLISEQIQPEQPGYASTVQTFNVDENSEAKETGSDVPVTTSGPLGGLDSDVEFTGALSRGVCIACGAESSDLFCLACGLFIEDIS